MKDHLHSMILVNEKVFNLHDVQWFGFLSIFSAFVRIKFIRKVLTFTDFLLSKTPLNYFSGNLVDLH